MCINQTDMLEKAVQIPLMQEIYSKTRVTVCWLHNVDDIGNVNELKRAMLSLREIGQASIDASLADLNYKEYA